MDESNTVPDFVLKVLRCPRTHSRLRPAAEHELARLNAAIEAGRLHNELGQRIDERLEEALLNENSSLAYPVRYSIPLMLAEDAIHLDQLDSTSDRVEHAE